MVPVIELARAYLNVERGDDQAAIGVTLRERLADVDGEDCDEIITAFVALLDPDGEPPARPIGNRRSGNTAS